MTNIPNLLIGLCAAVILAHIFLLSGGENIHQVLGYSFCFMGILFVLVGFPKKVGTTIVGGFICLGLSFLILFQ